MNASSVIFPDYLPLKMASSNIVSVKVCSKWMVRLVGNVLISSKAEAEENE